MICNIDDSTRKNDDAGHRGGRLARTAPYTGEHLRRIALPLGGIGTGTISLGGRGDLRVWAHQAVSLVTDTDRPERWLVHLVNWSANRRATAHLETHEDPVPLVDVTVELDVPGAIGRAYVAPDGGALALERTAAGWRVTVPRVDVHTVVVFEVGARFDDMEEA